MPDAEDSGGLYVDTGGKTDMAIIHKLDLVWLVKMTALIS